MERKEACSSIRLQKEMSLDKAILHGKEKRKPYRGSKYFDRSCRNHGRCKWCRDNRLHKHRIAKERFLEKEY